MADANLTVGVEVALSVDENTAVWLESLGWVRPGAPSSEAVQTEPDEDDDWNPAEMMAVDVASLVPEAESEPRPLYPMGRAKALTGSEAQRCAAVRMRRTIMQQLEDQEQVDELLRLCDMDPTVLSEKDCDC
jgi:hypothetical protein